MCAQWSLQSPYKLIEELATDEEKKFFELDDLLVDIASALINYRIKHNLTQKDLAKKLNISQAMVSKLESGEYNPTIKLLWEISKVLDFEFEIKFREKVEEDLWYDDYEEIYHEPYIINKEGDAA